MPVIWPAGRAGAVRKDLKVKQISAVAKRKRGIYVQKKASGLAEACGFYSAGPRIITVVLFSGLHIQVWSGRYGRNEMICERFLYIQPVGRTVSCCE